MHKISTMNRGRDTDSAAPNKDSAPPRSFFLYTNGLSESVFSMTDIVKVADVQHEHFHFLQQGLIEVSAPNNIFTHCLKAFGERVDILINVAGIMDDISSAATFEDIMWGHVICSYH
jgi:NAD(P)-dependent dehydrogenase (short-subunit alcohol dehydrogenase family)